MFPQLLFISTLPPPHPVSVLFPLPCLSLVYQLIWKYSGLHGLLARRQHSHSQGCKHLCLALCSQFKCPSVWPCVWHSQVYYTIDVPLEAFQLEYADHGTIAAAAGWTFVQSTACLRIPSGDHLPPSQVV